MRDAPLRGANCRFGLHLFPNTNSFFLILDFARILLWMALNRGNTLTSRLPFASLRASPNDVERKAKFKHNQNTTIWPVGIWAKMFLK